MVVISKSLKISSSSNFQIIDISSDITAVLNEVNKEHKMDNGIVNIFTKHSTSAIRVNENEKGLLLDFEKALKDIVKEKDNYKHDFIDNNAKSHLKSFLLSSSQTIPVSNGRLELGTWQSVFFVELDGPRTNRTIVITVVGD